METSINGQGDLEKGLLGTANTTVDKKCEEWTSKHSTAIAMIAVIVTGAGFLVYICVLVLEMRSDVSSLKTHTDNIDGINAEIGNLQYEIGAIKTTLNGLVLQVESICRHITC